MKKGAFSLVELSVVLVVIGILTVAITKGSSLIHASRVSSAKSLTVSSKIHEMEGLVAWYENVLPDSLDRADRVDNEEVAYWQDISSQVNIANTDNRLTRVESSDVVYRTDGIGGLPSLQFTASGNFTLDRLVAGNSNEITVFAVLSPTLALGASQMTFIDSYDTGNNSLSLKTSAFTVESVSTDSIVGSFSEGEEYVIGASMASGTVKVYINDVVKLGDVSVAINGFNGLTLGTDRGGADNFTGFISEVIIFHRVLNESERRHVMSYLSKKYKIRVEGAAI